MTMKEKIARALCAHNEAGDESMWNVWMGDSEAVLNAMREPPENMIDAYNEGACSNEGATAQFSLWDWNKAIDAALKE